jgi:cysteine synthase
MISNYRFESTLCRDVSEAVGLVPIIRLNRLGADCTNHELFLKIEACNPGGSIKEKNAVYLIQHAERAGLLKPGGVIVESSSGNFGIGLAMIGASKGYRVIIVVDAKTPTPMRRLLAAYGAELVDVPLTAADSNGSMHIARMRKAKKISEKIKGSWYPCQHFNPLNGEGHSTFTAVEIDAAFGNSLDAIVVGISTAGQLSGLVKYFRQRHPETKFVGVDVAGSAIFGVPSHPYKMTGLGLSFVPPNFDPMALDCAFSVDDELSFSICHLLAKREGLLLGASTGAIVAAGIRYAQLQNKPSRVLMINPDRGDRYLETMYDEKWLKNNQLNLLDYSEVNAKISALRALRFAIEDGVVKHEK